MENQSNYKKENAYKIAITCNQSNDKMENAYKTFLNNTSISLRT
jgi:hypothetical protein